MANGQGNKHMGRALAGASGRSPLAPQMGSRSGARASLDYQRCRKRDRGDNGPPAPSVQRRTVHSNSQVNTTGTVAPESVDNGGNVATAMAPGLRYAGGALQRRACGRCKRGTAAL